MINGKTFHGLDLFLFKMQNILESASAIREASQFSSRTMQQVSFYSNIADAMNPIREAIERICWTYEPIRSSRLNMMGVASQLSEALRVASVAVNTNALQNALRSITISNDFRRAFDGINNLNLSYMKAISDLSINTRAIEQTIQKNLELFRNIDLSLLIQDVEVAEPDQAFDDFDIEGSLGEAVIDLNSNISFQQKILKILELFKRANPIIFFFICFLVLSPLQAAYNDYILDLIGSKTKSITAHGGTSIIKTEKKIKIEVNNTLNINIDSKKVKEQILNHYRYVSTDSLAVKKDKSVRSKTVSNLEFGQAVKLLYKNKNWTLIEYVDEKDNIIQGWVFTRYISRFKK